jgi:hypothetical protein
MFCCCYIFFLTTFISSVCGWIVKHGLQLIGYGTTIEIFPHGGFHRLCTMGLRWPQNPKDDENFIGQLEKLSRAATTRACKGKRKKLLSVWGNCLRRQLLQNSNRFTGLGDPFADSAGVTFVQTQHSTHSWHTTA